MTIGISGPSTRCRSTPRRARTFAALAPKPAEPAPNGPSARRSLARPSAGDLDGYSGLIAKLPSALQVDTEAVQKAELDEVWGPAGKLERGRLVGETAPTAPTTPKTRGKRQEAGGKSEAARRRDKLAMRAIFYQGGPEDEPAGSSRDEDGVHAGLVPERRRRRRGHNGRPCLVGRGSTATAEHNASGGMIDEKESGRVCP
jgi:hypothetical protein